MGVQDLWTYVLEKCPEACKTVSINKCDYTGGSQLRLIVDAEDCLSRLYGGYYNDWICGGSWNRLLTFLQELKAGLIASNMVILPAFNTTLDLNHLSEWHKAQVEIKETLNNIFRQMEHASLSGQWKPPPKIWWVAPSCLEITLRMALKMVEIPIKCTMTEHRQEVMQSCKAMKFHGIVGESADYLIFQPPRLFSSVSLKLKRTGQIESKEFNIDLMLRIIDIHPKRLQLLAALLGNHILTTTDLHGFYCMLLERDPLCETEISPRAVMEAVLGFIRRLDNPDPDYVGNIIFRGTVNADRKVKADLIQKLKCSIEYYTNVQSDKPITIIRTPVLPGSYTASVTENGLDSDGKEAGTAINGSLNDAVSRLTLNEERDCDTKNFNVPARMLNEAKDRHSKGIMHPWIYHILTKGSIRFPIGVEYESSQTLPLSVDIYRLVRSRAYAVLFDSHDSVNSTSSNMNREKAIVTEWVVRKTSLQSEKVVSHGLKWIDQESKKAVNIPKVEDLWFRKDFVHERTRTFLSCLGMESADRLFDTKRVDPQHLLLCCLLRYMIQSKLLCSFEFNAFLIQAVHPNLHNYQEIQNMKIPFLNMRAVQLATIFMKGVEHLIFINDVCGAPIPWQYTAPWRFFDGRLFHYVYSRLEAGDSASQICMNGQSCVSFEKLRRAVLDRFPNAEFTSPFGLKESVNSSRKATETIPQNSSSVQGYFAQLMTQSQSQGFSPYNFKAPQLNNHMMMKPIVKGRGRGRAMGSVASKSAATEPGYNFNHHPQNDINSGLNDYRGGKLHVAGIPVSNWAPNMQVANTHSYPKGRGRGFLSGPFKGGDFPQSACATQFNNNSSSSIYPQVETKFARHSLSAYPIINAQHLSAPHFKGRGRSMRSNFAHEEQLGLDVNPSIVGFAPFIPSGVPSMKRSNSYMQHGYRIKGKNFFQTKNKSKAQSSKKSETSAKEENSSPEKESIVENESVEMRTSPEPSSQTCDNSSNDQTEQAIPVEA